MNRKCITTGTATCAWFLVVVCLAGTVSCSKPTPVEFNDLCRKENHNVYVSVEGYLRAGSTVLCSSREGTRACGLELFERADGGGKISVFLEEGTGESQMEPLPKNYGREDLKIRTANGQMLEANDRVRVIGIAMNGADVIESTYSICFITIERLERP